MSLLLENMMLLEINESQIKQEEHLKKIATELEEIYLMLASGTGYTDPDKLHNIQSLAKTIIVKLKPLNNIYMATKIISTAKAMLWEIEQQKKWHQNTVGSLLDFLQTSPGWVGDDFEECLEYVNEVRRQ
jgi:hypothetical protein